MKLTTLALAAAVSWALYAGSVLAQETPAQQPAHTAYAADYYYFQPPGQPSPSDQVVPLDKMVQAPAGGCVSDAAPEEVCEPWRLFCQKDCGWNINGFVEVGGATNDDASFFNGPTTFPDYSDIYLNQLYAVIENKIDTGGCGWDLGGRIDFLYGTDYIFTQAIGLETHPDGSPHWNGGPFYGLALPQAYGEVGYNDLSVKVGHFYTAHGYEVVPATGNFFYTHAYAMQYGEPFTHTGALATWKANENLSLMGAIVNGWDAFDRVDDEAMGMGGFTWTNGDNFTLAYMYGYSVDEPTTYGATTPRHISTLVATLTRCDWTYVFQNDVGWQQEGVLDRQQTGGDPFSSSEWYGINQYLFYTINDCWKAGTRFEWFRDDDGTRVGRVRANNPLPANGFAGNFYGLAMGLNWTPHANFMVRPELRYDWYDGDTFTGQLPFDTDNAPGDDEQLLAAMDVIFLW